ncbi:FixH family protein [Hyphomicrobium sulfonivorans]|uniref:FixH family protein n=1 Tax=Hyphomicrobium sulfonivorans TaxID=121290 RepID=UPI001570331D|nr:FixH family protein [Hyphomicrobium sulfonivorans]MBI1649230.1 FixH family protein [Hyphomicrobium sulfonivorans]NSL70239.1 hypothetical protein [Hyphomicrobium sulfonivorans]
MSETAAPALPRGRRLQGRHVFMILVGFFATIVVVDGFMIYQAVTTFGGLETNDAYRKGLHYNDRIERQVAQSANGWSDTVSVVGTPAKLRVVLHGRDNETVAGQALRARVGRPATNRYDMNLELVETAPGLYEAPLGDEMAGGAWIVDVSAFNASTDNDPAYQARSRIWIGQ